jgi:hypothetical protein
LTLSVTSPYPSLTLPVTNGQTVATLQGTWSDGSPFTGTYQFAPPNFNHSGDYAISGNAIVVNNAGNLNAIGTVTVEHVSVTAVQ